MRSLSAAMAFNISLLFFSQTTAQTSDANPNDARSSAAAAGKPMDGGVSGQGPFRNSGADRAPEVSVKASAADIADASASASTSSDKTIAQDTIVKNTAAEQTRIRAVLAATKQPPITGTQQDRLEAAPLAPSSSLSLQAVDR